MYGRDVCPLYSMLSHFIQFTHKAQRPWRIRLLHIFRRWLSKVLRYPTPTNYTSNPIQCCLPTAYMLLEHIGPEIGEMLSNTYNDHQEKSRRQNLFRGLSRLMLSLARVPQPRIGSFEFHDDCTISLTNRPLTCSAMILESEGARSVMQRHDTYSSTEPFASDILALHGNYLFSNPNAILDDGECRSQMAAQLMLKVLSHHYIERKYRAGPFFLQLTDLHASNTFCPFPRNVSSSILANGPRH